MRTFWRVCGAYALAAMVLSALGAAQAVSDGNAVTLLHFGMGVIACACLFICAREAV